LPGRSGLARGSAQIPDSPALRREHTRKSRGEPEGSEAPRRNRASRHPGAVETPASAIGAPRPRGIVRNPRRSPGGTGIPPDRGGLWRYGGALGKARLLGSWADRAAATPDRRRASAVGRSITPSIRHGRGLLEVESHLPA